jgi:hypothetical protein
MVAQTFIPAKKETIGGKIMVQAIPRQKGTPYLKNNNNNKERAGVVAQTVECLR